MLVWLELMQNRAKIEVLNGTASIEQVEFEFSNIEVLLVAIEGFELYAKQIGFGLEITLYLVYGSLVVEFDRAYQTQVIAELKELLQLEKSSQTKLTA